MVSGNASRWNLLVAGPTLLAIVLSSSPCAADVSVDLGHLTLQRGSGPTGSSWIATPTTPAPSMNGHSVGWFANDVSAGGMSLHYGAQNYASYATSHANDPAGRNQGTVWSPAYQVSPGVHTCTISFEYSFALDPNRSFESPSMTFGWSFGGAWTSQPIYKPASSQPWTTMSQSFSCEGTSKLLLRWSFDTIDSRANKGRGLNLRKLHITGVYVPTPRR